MREGHDWGRDPAVRRARVLFGEMEQARRDVLERAGIAAFDARLRAWTEEALVHFERAWHASGSSDAAALYRECFTRIVTAAGVAVPDSAPSASEPGS